MAGNSCYRIVYGDKENLWLPGLVNRDTGAVKWGRDDMVTGSGVSSRSREKTTEAAPSGGVASFPRKVGVGHFVGLVVEQ